MAIASQIKFRVADRIWIAVAMLHQEFPSQSSFSKAEIRRKLEDEKLDEGVEIDTINAHLDQNSVGNVAPSSGKYRMLFELTPGNLRLFRFDDQAHPDRIQKRSPSKMVPKSEHIPKTYWPLLDWYETWSKGHPSNNSSFNWEDDPLIRLIGSGKHIWADEHADEYVERLRSEEPDPKDSDSEDPE